MEILRFGVTGSEANYQAVRVARAYTGKNMYVKFNGHFHGGPDYIVGGYVPDPSNPRVVEGADDRDNWAMMCNTKGRAKHAFDDAYMIEYNDMDAMRTLFEKDGDNIACVLMEPFPVNCNGCEALPGYMQGVRELCDKYKVVMIFDEVLTGFRIGLGGSAEYYGVQPDLWTFSKAIGGGFPVSVYGGKAEVMEGVVDCSALAPGTFNGHPLAMAAVINVIEQLQENDGEIFKRIGRFHEMLKAGLLENAKKHGIDMIVQGFPGALVPVFTKKDRIINNADALDNASVKKAFLFAGLMKGHGILNSIRLCIGAGHTEDDIAKAIEASDGAFAEMAEIINSETDINELVK
jgi:glutamate-1-semialdehyde 2,1-aminomutase